LTEEGFTKKEKVHSYIEKRASGKQYTRQRKGFEYVCNYCGMICKRPSSMRMHIQFKHLGKNPIVEAGVGKNIQNTVVRNVSEPEEGLMAKAKNKLEKKLVKKKAKAKAEKKPVFKKQEAPEQEKKSKGSWLNDWV